MNKSSSIESALGWLGGNGIRLVRKLKDRPVYIVCIFMAVYAFYFSYYTILNHYTFRTYAYDLILALGGDYISRLSFSTDIAPYLASICSVSQSRDTVSAANARLGLGCSSYLLDSEG
jgi:hypothetical protein